MLDAILIADSGLETVSASNPLRLRLNGQTATLQVVRNYLDNNGHVVEPVAGQGVASWEAAPKLNGIYLYNALAKSGFDVALIDCYEQERERFSALLAHSPRAIIISTTFTLDRQKLLDLVREIKRLCPTAKVIVGGPFVIYSWRVLQRNGEPPYDRPEFVSDILFFDAQGDETDLYVVSDVGEELLIEVLKRLRNGRALSDLSNTAQLVDGCYCFMERVSDVESWQEVPIDWSELPDSVFRSGVVPIRASTGCPHNCSFCNFIKNRHLTHVKPLDDLVAELKAVQARGARYVWFADDNFRMGKRDLEAVCARFVAEGLTLKWMTRARAEVLEEVDLDLLRRAGCLEIQMGLESADQTVLDAMDKRSNPELNEAVVERLLRAGINCSCYFIVGFPGETEASVTRTVAALRRLEAVPGEGAFTWSFYPFLLAPISPIFESDQRAKHGLKGYRSDWQHRTMDSKQARNCLLKAFMALERSGPIYRDDNLDMLQALPPDTVKAFMTARHDLEKLALQKKLDDSTALAVFREVFNTSNEGRRNGPD